MAMLSVQLGRGMVVVWLSFRLLTTEMLLSPELKARVKLLLGGNASSVGCCPTAIVLAVYKTSVAALMICRSLASVLETKARGRILLTACVLLPLLPPLQPRRRTRRTTPIKLAPIFKLGTRNTGIFWAESRDYSRARSPASLRAPRNLFRLLAIPRLSLAHQSRPPARSHFGDRQPQYPSSWFDGSPRAGQASGNTVIWYGLLGTYPR